MYRLIHSEATLRALIVATDSDAVASAVTAIRTRRASAYVQERLLKATAKKANVNIKVVRQMPKDAMAHRSEGPRGNSRP